MTKKPESKIADIIGTYRDVFGTPDGEKVLADMMKAHHMMGGTYNGDANNMIFMEGQRAVVLRILSFLKIDIQELQKRIMEYGKEA